MFGSWPTVTVVIIFQRQRVHALTKPQATVLSNRVETSLLVNFKRNSSIGYELSILVSISRDDSTILKKWS